MEEIIDSSTVFVSYVALCGRLRKAMKPTAASTITTTIAIIARVVVFKPLFEVEVKVALEELEVTVELVEPVVTVVGCDVVLVLLELVGVME